MSSAPAAGQPATNIGSTAAGPHQTSSISAPSTATSTTERIQIQTPADLTASWLGSALALASAPTSFTYARVGTGQMSECYRVSLVHPSPSAATAPSSVILKVASQDPSSRSVGVSLGLYQREILFYQQIAPSLPEGPIAKCYYAAFNESTGCFCLLFADAAPCKGGDDVNGATPEQAAVCLRTLGQIHGHMLRTGVQGLPWLKREQPLTQPLFQTLFAGFVARYRDVLTVEHLDVCSKLVACYDAYKEQQNQKCVSGLIHGDFRLDNIVFEESGPLEKLKILDWQTVLWGPVLGDVAYFLGAALPVEVRRKHFDDLLQTYYDALGSGTELTSLERCRDDLRNQSFFGLVMVIASSMMVQRTERGDHMFTTMIKRHCELVLDLKAADILPAPTKVEVLQPSPEDEHVHPRGEEKLFNESYYFDFVDEKQGLGVYVRLGITPNVGTGGWHLAVVSRKGEPLASIMDYTSPVADETLRLKTETYEAEHIVEEALKKFRVKLNGKASVHDDEAAIFTAEKEQGQTDIALDLLFHTDGVPYKYRVATRYEIPCLVDGMVRVGGQQYTVTQQVGQRDHSWGVRNWWNMDWFWGGIHLTDESHIHLIDLRIQGQGQLGVGYYQTPTLGAVEVQKINSKWEFSPSTNLLSSSTLFFTPQIHGEAETPFTVTVEPLGHGPLRLVSDEGKVSLFDRAWCKCTLDDGRVGYGWLEWNRVQED